MTLYFDADTYQLVGVIFSAQNGQTTIHGTITVSTAEEQTLTEFPEPDAICDGTLYEEWTALEP